MTQLKRSLGYLTLTLYGIGNMLGAGIYGLVGKAAAEMGNALWLAFIASAFAAGLTGLCYASLGSRYPKAAGAAYVSQRAFGSEVLSYTIGLAVLASGLTSMAASSRIFAGYASQLLAVDLLSPLVIALALVTSLALVNFWGMREAAILTIVCTLIEASGLILVVLVGIPYWGSVNYLDLTSQTNPEGLFHVSVVLSASVLTFYAFIGFEDLLNISEEVKDPEKNFPRALVTALSCTLLLYLAVSITVVSVVPHQLLANSTAPLSEVIAVAAPWVGSQTFSIIALFAVLNTALLNYLMASRLAYGMARQGLLPTGLGAVHAKRHTPHVAIVCTWILVSSLLLIGDISQLSRATSLLLLLAFTVVNASLWRLQQSQNEPRGHFEVWSWVPLLAASFCLFLICTEIVRAITTGDILPLGISTALLGGIVGLYCISVKK